MPSKDDPSPAGVSVKVLPESATAAVVRLLEIEAKLILIDDPLATLLHSHRDTSQRTVTFIDKAIMHLVSKLHPRELCLDSCPR